MGFWLTADLAQVQAELECGADATARDGRDVTPLHYAAGFGDDPAVIQALLDAGADLEAKIRDEANIHNQDHFSFGSGSPGCIMRQCSITTPRLLSSRRMNTADHPGRQLITKTRRCSWPCWTPAPTVRAEDSNGMTPLHGAAWFNRNPAVIKALLDAGANIEAVGEFGLTPLFWAASGNPNPAVTQALLEARRQPQCYGRRR